ncbi:MAG: hypothetical protein ACTFAL_14270 [Candidatus Electronema sp. V4]|uniref:hypothetical protein n=1 Tax=Candidatus Electronema sp. V4 TaxID=3454756 RepID=UPI00405597AC
MEESKNLPADGSGANQANETREMDRRQALAALGKFALFAAPTMSTLLTARRASAASPPPPPGGGGSPFP